MHQQDVFISSDVRTPGKVKTWPRPWTAAEVKVPFDCDVDDIRILRDDDIISDTTLGAANKNRFLYILLSILCVFSNALILAV